MKRCLAALFDLDGVLVDTARYHYQAWKEIAKEYGFDFTEEQNELLKGVSRSAALDILLDLGNLTVLPEKKPAILEKKNNLYLQLIEHLAPSDILKGVLPVLHYLQDLQIPIVLGSASKNARGILQRLGLIPFFTAIIDGTNVTKAKPDPEVFLAGAKACGIEPFRCVVFEDSVAGIQAAKLGGMIAVGIGNQDTLCSADFVVDTLDDERVYALFSKTAR
ncbi:beta-phosphoglucomutase [uncultured Sphaerochaeta sp.]|uniref:beta-phosphoglucomutase n=1 Tax=uncultured Sphaerochaeta sp. TaxID=886478 RepID=UPI002A0A2DB3|nr:beta-phosphoglucomutase [uncultured Sphaerochaeta sp.]